MKTFQFVLLLIITVNRGYCGEIRTPLVVKNNDLQVINAAIEHPDGSAYFFVGKYYHQYDTKAQKLKSMGLIGKDAWYGLPANIDAALVHPQNKKGYFFRGNQYHRYDFSKRKVDKTGILNSNGWKGVEGPIDAAIMHPTNNCAYFFKGKKYYRYNFAKKKMDRIGTIGVDAWKGMPARMDAAIMHSNGRAYGFKDDHYYRYVYGKKVDKKGVTGKDGWKLFHQLDAVVYNFSDKNISTGANHYIVGSNAFYLSNEFSFWGSLTGSGPNRKITKKKFGHDWYKGAPSNIDAGFLHPKNGRYYFFKGDKYYRYNTATKKIDKIAKIKDGFGVGSVDASFADNKSKTIYLFKGSQYHMFNVDQNVIIGSGAISSKFKGIPNYLDAASSAILGSGINFYKKDVVYILEGNKLFYRQLSPSLFN
mgnify:CR=1 FL=1